MTAGGKIYSIDDYVRFLDETLHAWSPERRLAFAAAMTERWLPVYEAFSAREEWGDPAHLRRSLEAVWNHLGGSPLAPADVRRYIVQLEDSTPHMDDFDDEAALAALATCMMLHSALHCCRTTDNAAAAIQAVLSGLEAVVPDWETALEEQPRLWQQVLVRREFEKQRLLVDEIEAIAHFDEATIQALRQEVRREKYRGEITPDPEATEGPATITNQQAFERYRAVLEVDQKDSTDDWWEETSVPGSYMWAMWLLTAWSARYGRRQDIVAGTYGRLADVAGVQALLARNRALDGAETAVPDWGEELQELLDQTLQNERNGLDVTAFDQPHSYGPSLRCLWLEGQRTSLPGQEAWRHILTWARHRPAAWEVEDRRKKRGHAYTTPALGALLACGLDWQATGDPEYPWAAEVEGARWQVRLNDFPDDFMYSLLIDDQEVGSFHNWPETWRRD